MRKFATSTIEFDRFQGRPNRRLIHVLFALSIALILAPIAAEVGAVCAANWKSMSGRIDHVPTPYLDALRVAWHDTVGMFRMGLKGAYRRSMPWRPPVIIALGFGWALFMSVPLRRSH